MSREIRSVAEKAASVFNRYRSPEAVAKILSVHDLKIAVEFTGHFCRTCGFYDYFDDFAIFLEEEGIHSEIKEVKEKEDGAIVLFSVKR